MVLVGSDDDDGAVGGRLDGGLRRSGCGGRGLRVGPSGAVVADVDARRGPAAGGYADFDVEPTR